MGTQPSNDDNALVEEARRIAQKRWPLAWEQLLVIPRLIQLLKSTCTMYGFLP